MKIFALFFGILIFLSVHTYSQIPEIRVTADTNNVLIGESVRVTFEYKGDIANKVVFPVLNDTIGQFDILGISKIDTAISQNIMTLRQTFAVTSFDTGMQILPPIPFAYEAQGADTVLEAYSDGLVLYFATVEVDSAADLKDIKGPIQVPITFAELLPYILIAMAIGLLTVGIVFLLYNRKNKVVQPIIEKYDPKIPADLEALQALKELENKKLWQSGRHKLYHSELTDILRTYIHRIYSINSHEMTSDEILVDLKSKEISSDASDILQQILTIADLTKFAKYNPSDSENYNSMIQAVTFVNLTKTKLMLDTPETHVEEKSDV